MNPRMIHVAMLATVVAASGCAMQTDDPASEGVSSSSNGLITGDDSSGGTPKLDPSGGDQPGGQDDTPLPGDNPGDKREEQGDPGKPSPDPWAPPKEEAPLKPGAVDDLTVNPTVR